ncbi:MAG: hypothetical protein DWQ01_10805 [Planctomycetota bacterium]|nr:MAG: hypothetical protein DWQ01_10805 [Planctomycetota bacterium]
MLSATPLEQLHRQNLDWLRAKGSQLSPREPRLAACWQAALDGAGEVLRLSPGRTVLRLSLDEVPWVFKIHHPRRAGEAWRNRLRTPPALREAAVADRLRQRGLGLPQPWLAECPAPGLAWLARPWVDGSPLTELLPEQTEWAGRELAGLHRAGWSDPDLLSQDLLVSEGRLLPLDLGQARCSTGPAPNLAQRADLLLLLAAMSPRQAAAAAPRLLQGHGRAGGEIWPLEALLADAACDRRLSAWRRSRRAFRTNRDFLQDRGSHRRRNFPPPEQEPPPLADGSRTAVRIGERWVEKRYARSDFLGRWRSRLGWGPGRRAFRGLYLLEVLEIPAVQAWAYQQERQPADGQAGERLWTGRSRLAPCDRASLPAIATWLGRLHRSGFGFRDPKPENFLLGEHGPVLVDADGLRRRPKPRDLARLLAEVDFQDASLLQKLWQHYLAALGEQFPPGKAAVERWTRRFRRRLQQRQASTSTSLEEAGGNNRCQ